MPTKPNELQQNQGATPHACVNKGAKNELQQITRQRLGRLAIGVVRWEWVGRARGQNAAQLASELRRLCNARANGAFRAVLSA